MRKYFVFGVVGSSLFLSSVATTSVSVAFPVMVTDLNTSLVTAGWALSIIQLVAICAMPIAARLSDSYGRKLTFILCLILFTTGSFLCAIAPNVGWLILARAIQGLGLGGFVPTATGIVADEFVNSRQRAIGLFTSVFALGNIIGPNIGGLLVSAAGWKSVFWLNVPIGALELAAAVFLIRGDSKRSKLKLDVAGALLLAGGISAFMLGLTFMDFEGKVLWGLVGALAVLSVILFVLFLKRERMVQDPIISLSVLTKRPFFESNIYNFIFGAAVFGVFSLIPLYATSVYGMSTFASGAILTPRSIGQMVASLIISFLLVRWGYRKPILAGTFLSIISLLLLALESTGFNFLGIYVSPTMLILLLMFISGAGQGMIAPAANNACIELMPEKVATISGLRTMFRQMGGAIAINISTVVIQLVGDVPRAFTILLVGFAMTLIISIPTIFIMPASPKVVYPQKSVQHR